MGPPAWPICHIASDRQARDELQSSETDCRLTLLSLLQAHQPAEVDLHDRASHEPEATPHSRGSVSGGRPRLLVARSGWRPGARFRESQPTHPWSHLLNYCRDALHIASHAALCVVHVPAMPVHADPNICVERTAPCLAHVSHA